MPPEIVTLRDLRTAIKDLRTALPELWAASRHLVSATRYATTLARLRQAIGHPSLAREVRDALMEALPTDTSAHAQDRPSEVLKQLTGLPTTKAVRALCVVFGLLNEPEDTRPETNLEAWRIDPLTWFATHDNPFDLLLELDTPALLDLGAGDLSFVEALAQQYVPALHAAGRSLVIHALDRIHATSTLGTAFQPPPERTRGLAATPGLTFHYWNDVDMFALTGRNRPRAMLRRYPIVTCWAPANPTFAYEPTRLAPGLIRQDLERTRGSFREVRVDGERALEVRHQGRALLFPPWKFDVRGPAALLDLMTRLGSIVILGAVDAAVFWELLAQVVADARLRPQDRLFTDDARRHIFGPLYDNLSALPEGGRLCLSDVTALRPDMPRVLPGASATESTIGWRFVEIRRGAVFPRMPSSLTAQRYAQMTEEPTPWFLVLIPQ